MIYTVETLKEILESFQMLLLLSLGGLYFIKIYMIFPLPTDRFVNVKYIPKFLLETIQFRSVCANFLDSAAYHFAWSLNWLEVRDVWFLLCIEKLSYSKKRMDFRKHRILSIFFVLYYCWFDWNKIVSYLSLEV